MTTIKIIENGPAIVNDPTDGLISVITPDGKQENTETKTVAICRCGKSKNQPYCDGSHKPAEISKEKAAEFIKGLKEFKKVYNALKAADLLTEEEKKFLES